MSPQGCIDLFGLDVWESVTDLEYGFMMIRGSLDGTDKNEKVYINGEDYKDCISKYIDFVKRQNTSKFDSEMLNDFLILEPIPESFNIEKIIQFEKDLDDHFKTK